jgi:hypothetical protein
MVIRVGRDLGGQLDGIADRLFMETAYDHPRAAVIRGLIRLGLAAVARNDVLAPLFAGVRVARGRKRQDPFTRP